MDAAAESRTRTDPVMTEIVRNGVIAVTEEMKTNLMRTAYNLIIYEALDFTTGLFTATGETVSIGMGLPMFIRGMAATLKAKLAHFGAAGLEPGDILITNDGYVTGSHLNHVTVSLPIFHEGRLVAFACCMAHWLTVGGVLSGMTTDIFSEGLQIPILKLQSKGKLNDDLVDIIKMNVHLPERAMGDLRAQLTAVRTGGASSSCAIATARSWCSTPSPTSRTIPSAPRANARAPSPTAPTRPSRSWTTMASRSASASRSACGSR